MLVMDYRGLHHDMTELDDGKKERISTITGDTMRLPCMNPFFVSHGLSKDPRLCSINAFKFNSRPKKSFER